MHTKCPMAKLMKPCQLFTFLWFKSLHQALTNMSTQMLDNDLQSMIANRNKLDHQLRDCKLMIRMEREDNEKHLYTANQRSMAFQKLSNPNEEKALNGGQLANSMELPGHCHGVTMMSKVQHRMSDITTNLIANEDNVRKFYVPQALEQQIAINNQTSADAVKLAFAESLKHSSNKQSNPLFLETENV